MRTPQREVTQSISEGSYWFDCSLLLSVNLIFKSLIRSAPLLCVSGRTFYILYEVGPILT